MKTAAVTDLKNRLSHYLRLISAGLTRPPVAALPSDFLSRTLPRPKASVAEALVEDRADRF